MLRLEAEVHKLLQFDSVSEDGKSPEPGFWVSACNTITYIKTTTAAKRTVISLIKSPLRGRREKRPRRSLRPATLKPDSSSHKGIDLTAEDTRLSHSLFWHRGNYGDKELHWMAGCAVCVEKKKTLHLKIFLRRLLAHKQRRRLRMEEEGKKGSETKQWSHRYQQFWHFWRKQETLLEFVNQFLMNEWGTCMQTMPKAKSAVYSSTHTCGYRILPKGPLRWEYSAQALTCLFHGAGVELGAAEAQGGSGGSKLLRRGNARCKGQEGETVW